MKKQNHKITIEKLGPIKEITFEVRDVNAVIGKSATGKSLLAKAIYCFNQPEFVNLLASDLEQAIEELASNIKWSFEPYSNFSIIYDYGNDHHISINHNSDIEFSRKLSVRVKKVNKKVEELEQDAQAKHYQKTLIEAAEKGFKAAAVRRLLNEIPESTKAAADVRNELLEDLGILPAIFIPATRSFVTDFDDIRLRRSRFYHRRRPLRVNTPITNSNNDMVLTIFSDVCSEYTRRFDTLDHPLMQGEVRKINGEGLKFIVKDSKQVLDLSEISSGQKEMFPILMILQELKRQGLPSLIIVEEPEAHIYPEDQKILLDHIIEVAKATKSKVFLTTHTPYVLMEVNTLMKANANGYEKLERRFIKYSETNVGMLKDGEFKNLIYPEDELIDLHPIESVDDTIIEEFEDILSHGRK